MKKQILLAAVVALFSICSLAKDDKPSKSTTSTQTPNMKFAAELCMVMEGNKIYNFFGYDSRNCKSRYSRQTLGKTPYELALSICEGADKERVLSCLEATFGKFEDSANKVYLHTAEQKSYLDSLVAKAAACKKDVECMRNVLSVAQASITKAPPVSLRQALAPAPGLAPASTGAVASTAPSEKKPTTEKLLNPAPIAGPWISPVEHPEAANPSATTGRTSQPAGPSPTSRLSYTTLRHPPR